MALFMTHDQIEAIVEHVSERGHYPEKSNDQIRSRIQEILDNFDSSKILDGTRQIWRKAKDVLISDGKGGGTMFEPTKGAIRFFRDFF